MRKYTPLGIILCALGARELFEEWRRDKYLATSRQESRICIWKVQIADLVRSSTFLLQMKKHLVEYK